MPEHKVDVLLVGGGIMSATLASLLRELDPAISICMVERLERIAGESTNGWNNAGTGHAGYCELNYTPQLSGGNVDIGKALAINEAFEISLQYWAYLVYQGKLPAPPQFIRPVPHLSFVSGDRDVAFLRQRHAQLSSHHLFRDMQYSENPSQLMEWMPLVMRGRATNQAVAATRVHHGTDVDFGSLTRHIVDSLQRQDGFELLPGHSVSRLKQLNGGRWRVIAKDAAAKKARNIDARFVFIGAGGGALPLLQQSGIEESRGYGGFPVSGQWLVCSNPDLAQAHGSKVYGNAPIGMPPMSVPHLDARYINGKPALLFGPYASFTTRFQKQGSLLDLLKSVKPHNLLPMLAAGRHNIGLTRYLLGQALQSDSTRFQALKSLYPEAREVDWSLIAAGKRVQIIRKCKRLGGTLEFGTEIVTSRDGTLAALLGASPGASTSVQAMLQVIERCMKDRMGSSAWQTRLGEMIPSYSRSLSNDSALLQKIRPDILAKLGLA